MLDDLRIQLEGSTHPPCGSKGNRIGGVGSEGTHDRLRSLEVHIGSDWHIIKGKSTI